MERLITSEEVAEILHVDPVTVRRLINRGEIAAYRIGADYRFAPSDLEDYLQNQRIPASSESDAGINPSAVLNQLTRWLRSSFPFQEFPTPATSASSGRDRFDKFTERARRVLSLSQEEAQRLQHNFIGTEHLLLGLMREGGGVAAQVLSNLKIELEEVRDKVEALVERGEHTTHSPVGLTRRAKKVLEMAVEEARRFDHHYLGTEHLLLGLMREGEGIAAHILTDMGLALDQVRTEILQVLKQLENEKNIILPPPPEAASLVTEGEQEIVCGRCGAHCLTYFRHCFNCGRQLTHKETDTQG